jgi:4-aminobutyrate aminotransferase-like enzyme
MALTAIATLEDPSLPKRIQETGITFLSALNRLALAFPTRLKNPRGQGLMLGIDFIDENNQPRADWTATTITEALRHGLIILNGGPHHHTLTLTPPFCIEHDDISCFEEILGSILTMLK